MKLWLKSVICSFVISGILSMTGFCSVCDNLQEDVFRLHILANSDSPNDQQLKLQVRDGILAYTAELFADCTSLEQTISTARQNLDKIQSYGQLIVREHGYDYDVDVYITNMDFDTRVYDNFTLPAGKYNALRILIGEGKGHNWWCMLYPALCVPSAQQNKPETLLDDSELEVISHADQYQVKFKLVEIFQSICSIFC